MVSLSPVSYTHLDVYKRQTKIVIPRNNYEAVKDTKGIEIWPVDNLRQAINIVLGGNKE